MLSGWLTGQISGIQDSQSPGTAACFPCCPCCSTKMRLFEYWFQMYGAVNFQCTKNNCLKMGRLLFERQWVQIWPVFFRVALSPEAPDLPPSGKAFSQTWQHQCRHTYGLSSTTEGAAWPEPREVLQVRIHTAVRAGCSAGLPLSFSSGCKTVTFWGFFCCFLCFVLLLCVSLCHRKASAPR